MGDMDPLSRFEFMISESTEYVFVAVDEYPKAGRGHDGGWSSGARRSEEHTSELQSP